MLLSIIAVIILVSLVALAVVIRDLGGELSGMDGRPPEGGTTNGEEKKKP